MLHLERIGRVMIRSPDAGHCAVARLAHVEPAGRHRAQHGQQVGDDTEHEQGGNARREHSRHQAIL